MRTFFQAATLASLALASIQCGDSASSDASGSTAAGGPCNGPTPEERAQNQAVFDALSPRCVGCHATGARGYFASIQAFESLVVYDERLVVPGKPDESELVRLLEGTGTRAFTQMPIAGAPYAELADTGMKMPDIRAWVVSLEKRARDVLPSIDAPRVTRLSADQVRDGLYQQLGLSDEDFYVEASSFDVPHKASRDENNYPMASLDDLPGPYEGLPAERFASLGGGSAALQVKTDPTVSPSFLGSITQVSQRWCAMALEKPGNTALLPAGASIEKGSDDPDAVKSVIRHWFLHFHAVDASPADVDEIYATVFVPLENEKDAKNGYVGTCSTFIRHPDWIFY